MNLEITQTLPFALTLAALAIIGLGVRWVMGRLARAKAPPSDDAESTLHSGDDRLIAIMAEYHEAQAGRLEGLTREVSAMKADLDWLAGDRMIEQAIAMARDGTDPDEISANVGLSLETARTLATLHQTPLPRH